VWEGTTGFGWVGKGEWWRMKGCDNNRGLDSGGWCKVAKSRSQNQTVAWGVQKSKYFLLAHLMQLFAADILVQSKFNFDQRFCR
jgi:hypothetical protein